MTYLAVVAPGLMRRGSPWTLREGLKPQKAKCFCDLPSLYRIFSYMYRLWFFLPVLGKATDPIGVRYVSPRRRDSKAEGYGLLSMSRL